MSLSLCFDIKGSEGAISIPFPFQTPTELTNKILGTESTEDRLIIIEKYLADGCRWDDSQIEKTIRFLKRCFLNECLELGIT